MSTHADRASAGCAEVPTRAIELSTLSARQSRHRLSAELEKLPDAEQVFLRRMLSRLLQIHVCYDHSNLGANRSIRLVLDQVQLLLALEIERTGLDARNAGGGAQSNPRIGNGDGFVNE